MLWELLVVVRLEGRLTTRKSLTTVGGPNLFLYNLIENDFVGQVLWEISRPNIIS